MQQFDTYKRKYLYKLTLATLKVLPVIMAFSLLLNTICAFFSIGLQVITHYLGLVIAPLLFMYLTSYVFKFCNYHRIFIHYIAVVELLNITDWYIGIPLSNSAICIVHFIISAVFLLTAIIMYWYKYKYKKHEKD